MSRWCFVVLLLAVMSTVVKAQKEVNQLDYVLPPEEVLQQPLVGFHGNYASLLPLTVPGTSEHFALHPIQVLLSDPLLPEMLGHDFNPLECSSNEVLLKQVLQRLLLHDRVAKNDELSWRVRDYLQLLSADRCPLDDGLGPLVPPVPQVSFKMN